MRFYPADIVKRLALWGLLLAAVTSTHLPLQAQNQDRLDRIILLMAVNLSGSPAPLPGPGDAGLVIYGAVSAEAAIAAMQELIQPLGETQAKNIRFAPVSYRYLISSAENASKSKTAVKALLLPDPKQVNHAEKLYLQQGVSASEARELARSQPTVFCPEPAVYAEINTGANKGKRIIPCSFDFEGLQGLVSPTAGPKPDSAIKVTAIPWQPFINLMSSGTQPYLNDIEVLLSPQTQQAIQKTREDRQFLKRD